MKKFFVVFVAIAISIFGIGCGKGATKEALEISNKSELFSVVDLNTVQGLCEYYLDSLTVTKRIEPSTITEDSSYYDITSEDSIYIDALIGIKNLNSETKIEIILIIDGRNFSNAFI